MPIADTKKVQSLIQGILEGQVDVEAGLTILLDSPGRDNKIRGWLLIFRAIGKMSRIKAQFLTHSPSFSGTNLSAPQASDLNSYYAELKQLLIDADEEGGGYIAFRDGVNQAQTEYAAIITILKSKNIPSHSTRSLD